MYKNLTDEEIIKKYREGDEFALDFLLKKYKSLASKISRSYFLVGAESEDVLQEAMLGLYSACRTYAVDNNNNFKTFATLCITRAVQSAVKSANRQKNKILNECLSLTNQGTVEIDANSSEDDVYLYIPSSSKEPEDIFLEKERKNELDQIINENLSTKEKQVLLLYLQGLSYAQIAENLNQTTKAVDNAISRTKKKLEELL